jgi:hypothetical protein
MAETSFDVLSQFSNPNLNIKLSVPKKSSQNIQISEPASNVSATMPNMEDVYSNVNQQYADAISDYYAGTYLPILTSKQQNIAQAKADLGFGTRYKAKDFKAQIEAEFGQIPKASNGEKAFNMLFDMLTKTSDYRGAAAVFDVGIQSIKGQMDRDKVEKAEQIKRDLLISEMAIKQANDMNQIMLAKEGELVLKGMGYTEDMLSEMMNYSGDVRLKIFDADIAKDKSIFDNQLDKEKMLYEHSLLMIRNPESSFPTLMYKEKDSDTVKTIPVQLKPNPVDGAPMYMLSRRVTNEQGQSFDIFDQPVPEDWSVVGIYTGDQPGTEAAALSKPFGAAQLSDIGTDYFVYTQAVDTFDQILSENIASIQAGDGPIIGTAGYLKDIFQKTKFAGTEFLNTLSGRDGIPGTLGTDIERLGQTAYSTDMANLRLAEQGQFDLQKVPDFNSEMAITYTVPGVFEKGTGINLPDKTVTKKTKLSDFFSQSFYELELGYNPVFARNKVRENYLVYAIARALKPSGRLNVNDVEAAREILTITSPFSSSAEVVTKITTIKDLLNQSAQNLVRSTFIDGKSVLDINEELKRDYQQRYGPLITAGQEPVVGQGGSSTDNSVGTEGTTEPDPNVPDFDINVIGGQ